MNQQEIINRCQQGNLSAFEVLYGMYSKKALGTAYIISGDKGIAEDIVQEAFILCYKNIKDLKNPETFNVWFYKILIRTGWRMASKNKAREYTGDILPDIDMGGIRSLNTEACFEASCNRLLIREAVQKLKLPFRTAVILYYFNEMPIKDISRVLGCHQGTVKSRLYKARLSLQKELEPYYTADIDENFMLDGKEQEANA